MQTKKENSFIDPRERYNEMKKTKTLTCHSYCDFYDLIAELISHLYQSKQCRPLVIKFPRKTITLLSRSEICTLITLINNELGDCSCLQCGQKFLSQFGVETIQDMFEK